MNDVLATLIAAIFLLLALWHFYLAYASFTRVHSAVPSVDGKPLFVPSKQSTTAIGMILLLFAALVAATSGLIPSALPHTALRWLSFALAFGLMARAIGDFNYVGFFKKVRSSRFATMDTWVYSPLCVALAAGVAYTASR